MNLITFNLPIYFLKMLSLLTRFYIYFTHDVINYKLYLIFTYLD